ncbi:MAG: chemotaxis protein CheW [Cyanobacteria bacterium P01_F01_bin.86]
MTQQLAQTHRLQSSEALLELIVFQLRQHWFCLPLIMIRKVLSKQLAQDKNDTRFIQLGHETIPVIDPAKLVYSHRSQLPESLKVPDSLPPILTSIQSILVIDHPCGEAVGLLIDGIPVIKRVHPSVLSPIAMAYLTVHHLQGISSVIELESATSGSSYPLFVLEIETLLLL